MERNETAAETRRRWHRVQTGKATREEIMRAIRAIPLGGNKPRPRKAGAGKENEA